VLPGELGQRGVFVLPGAKMYLSLAHSDEDLATTLDGPVAARRPGR
jgi:glutamate-1-semialdehyde aminotransferase